MVELIKQNFVENKKRYNLVLKTLRDIIEKNVPISHVGSTAIPDMVGKNIIDVLIGAKDDIEFKKLYDIISSLGYIASVNIRTDIYQFFASHSGETTAKDTHIHLVIIGTERYDEFLILRDYLLANPDEVKAYDNYKKEIVSSYTNERKEYRRLKSVFVEALIKRAKAHFVNINKQ